MKSHVTFPTNTFSSVVTLPAARGDTVEAKVAAYLHPAALQWASGSHKGLSTEKAAIHEPPSGTGLEAMPVPLEKAMCMVASNFQLEARSTEAENQEAQTRVRDKVGSEEVSLQMTCRGPTYGTPLLTNIFLCHRVDLPVARGGTLEAEVAA